MTLPQILTHCQLENYLESFQERFIDINGLMRAYNDTIYYHNQRDVRDFYMSIKQMGMRAWKLTLLFHALAGIRANEAEEMNKKILRNHYRAPR